MDDLISRQGAIDLIRDVCDAILSQCGSHYDGDDEVYDDPLEVDAVLKCNKEIRIALANMPSAQPEITKRTAETEHFVPNSDLISRKAAIEVADAVWCVTGDKNVAKVWDQIKDLPSVQERKGRWIHDGYDFPHGNDWIHCSECGKRGINVPADLTNYCPNCGAHMEGAEE